MIYLKFIFDTKNYLQLVERRIISYKKIDNIEKNEFRERYINDLDADVYDLEITRENFEIVMERIKMLNDFYAYQIHVFDFDDFLTPKNKREIIADARELFDEELTKEWE